jgi:hypothetical protein
MLSGDRAPRFAVGTFGFSEHTFGKSWRALNRFAHAANLDDVNSD